MRWWLAVVLRGYIAAIEGATLEGEGHDAQPAGSSTVWPRLGHWRVVAFLRSALTHKPHKRMRQATATFL